MITFELWTRKKIHGGESKKDKWKQLGEGELSKKPLENLMYSFHQTAPDFEFKLVEVNRRVINKI